MSTSKRSTLTNYQSRAFTLIEVLVVVAIIALLVSVLMPAMKSAKESAKATVCLSNMKQQGNGFAAYSKDNKQYLPVASKFRYFLMDGGYQSYRCVPALDNVWCGVGNGGLFPRYTGNTVDLFYCASNTDMDAESDSGKKRFLNNYNNPRPGYPAYLKAHDTPNAPIGAYNYGIPLAVGRSPRDGAKEFYPKESMFTEVCPPTPAKPTPDPASPSTYYDYLFDAGVTAAMDPKLGPVAAARSNPYSPNGPRGAYPTQALLSDAYFAGYRGYHVNGFNVLFNDFHAKRVGDASKKIDGITGNVHGDPAPAGSSGYNRAKNAPIFIV